MKYKVEKRQPIKPIANYDASIILVMYLKIVYLLNLLCILELYTGLLVYLFFLASQWFHTFKLFSNLHFLGLTFFTSEMFWNTYNTHMPNPYLSCQLVGIFAPLRMWCVIGPKPVKLVYELHNSECSHSVDSSHNNKFLHLVACMLTSIYWDALHYIIISFLWLSKMSLPTHINTNLNEISWSLLHPYHNYSLSQMYKYQKYYQ